MNQETTIEPRQSPLAWWGNTQEKSLTMARWMALYEAVNIIADKGEEKDIPLEKIEFKPLDIRDYMNATEDIFLRKILQEDYKIHICCDEDFTESLNPVEVNLKG
jgi:hypothetical protein